MIFTKRFRQLTTCVLLFALGLFCVLLPAFFSCSVASSAALPSDPINLSRSELNTQGVTGRQIPLTGSWQFLAGDLQPTNPHLVESSNLNWRPIQVPSNWYLQGQDLSGVVWYRHQFQVDPALQGKFVQLVFQGVDYAADVWLNGQHLGFHEGYFHPFRFPISDHLRWRQNNNLVVRVNSPYEEPGRVWSLHKRLIKGIFNHHDTRPGGAWSLRGQEKNTGGIWAPVFLQVSDQVAIASLKVTPQLTLPPSSGTSSALAHVELTVTNPATTAKAVQIRLQLQPDNFPGMASEPVWVTRTLRPGVNPIKIQLPAENPQLWWTWEHGNPNLYNLNVQIHREKQLLDQTDTVFGFRSIDFNPKTQVWSLNGKRIFIRGTNYISTQWLSEMTPEKYGYDLSLIKQANINAIRVHAHIEAQNFYHLCDRSGLLIWQDFPLQWGYTDDPAFIPEAARQATEMVDLLYNHPSIIAWSLHNEPPWDADWMKYKYPDYNPQQNQQLDQSLFEHVSRLDTSRWVQKAGTVKEHPWLGWYSGKWQDYAKPTQQAIITEFGAQALPNLPSLRRIFTDATIWPQTNADWEQWHYHNFQKHETFNIAQVPQGKNPQEFIDNTQQYQAQLTQLAAESYRRQRFQPVSTIFQFMFVEDWPSVNWGIVDYWRNPKPGYTALKTAYQPILPSIAWKSQALKPGESQTLNLWVINDLWQPFPQARLSYTLQRDWKTVVTKTMPVAIAADSAQNITTLQYPVLQPGQYQLLVQITQPDATVLGQNTFKFTVEAAVNHG